MKVYQGQRVGYAAVVTVNGSPLKPQLEVHNHSPSGFEWGYGGSGPAQLALALLSDHLGDPQAALNLYQRFKWKIVAELPHRHWTLTTAQIDAALEIIFSEEPNLSAFK